MNDIGVVQYCYMANDWKERLVEKISRIYNSGLYDAAKEYRLVVTDVNNERSILEEILSKYPKITLNYYSNNKLYETHAMRVVHELAKNNKSMNILYTQVRGVTNIFKNFETREVSETKRQSTKSYVEMLEYFLIDNWKQCSDKLDEGYHMAGVNCVYGIWWGGMWWANSEYVKNHPEFVFDENTDSRWKCERWIVISNPFHATPEYKSYQFYKHWCDTHYSILPKYLYDGTDRTSIKFNITKAEYGYFHEAADETHSTFYFDKDYIVDVTELVKNYIKGKELSFLDIHIEQNVLPKINFPEVCTRTNTKAIEEHAPKKLKIYFSTNIDETEYVVSSISTNKSNEISKIQI